MRTWQHVKTGGLYREVARGRMQSSGWVDEGSMHHGTRESVDHREVVIYQPMHRKDENLWWVRPVEEFEDGRFIEMQVHDKYLDHERWRERDQPPASPSWFTMLTVTIIAVVVAGVVVGVML